MPASAVKKYVVKLTYPIFSDHDAALADHPFKVTDGLEMGVDQRFIYELPEVLGALQLGGVRRLKHEPDAVWHNRVFQRNSAAHEDAFAISRACPPVIGRVPGLNNRSFAGCAMGRARSHSRTQASRPVVS
jgi:hypothetical protein